MCLDVWKEGRKLKVTLKNNEVEVLYFIYFLEDGRDGREIKYLFFCKKERDKNINYKILSFFTFNSTSIQINVN